MAWLNLRAEIAEEFHSFGASVDLLSDQLTIHPIALLPQRKCPAFVDRVAATIRTRAEWTAPELREALGVVHDASASKRVGKAVRELGWGYRRRHGGLRVYRPLAA